MRTRCRWLTVPVLVACLVALAGCGDDDGAAPTSPTDAEPPRDAGAKELTFTAVDIAFMTEAAKGAPGELQVTLHNDGAIEHSWVVEGHEDDLRLYTPSGETDDGSISLDAGEYTYYCDIAGHRAAGMEGSLSVG